MMITKNLIYVVVFNLLLCSALGNISDDIENRLKLATSDTAKVMTYNRFARELMNAEDPDYFQVFEYAQLGIELAEQIKFDKGQAELYRTLGVAFYYLNDYDHAIEHYEKALKICEKIDDTSNIAQNYYNIALIYRIKSNYYYSLDYFQKALLIWKKLGDTGKIITAYKSVVSMLRVVGELQRAIDYAEEAISLAIKIGNRQEEASFYDILAQINELIGNLELMEEYYKKSLQIYEELDDQLQIARITHNYAMTLYEGNPEISLALLRKPVAIYEKLTPNNSSLYTLYNNISKLHKMQNRNDSAVYYKKKALDKAILSENSQTMAEAYISTGELYMDNGDINRAETNFKKAYDIAIKNGLINIHSKSLLVLSSVNKQKGDFKTAVRYLEKYQSISDSLNREDIKKNIQQLTLQYEFEKDMNEQSATFNAQLERHEQAIKHQKTVVAIVSFALTFAAVLLVFIIRSNKRRKQANVKLEQQHSEILRINEELSKYKESLEEMVKEQMEKIQQGEIQLRTISDNLHGGCIYQKRVDRDGNGVISYISSTAEEWLGISAETIMSDVQQLYRQIIPEDLENMRKLEEDSIISMMSYTCEFRLMKGNEEVWLLENSMPHIDKEQCIVWDGIIVDITDRKKFEDELIEAKVHAEESDKLKSAFLANMSHEIRTPMNGIVGFLNFIERDDLPTVKRNAYTNIIRSNVQQLLQLIEDIIDISKIDSQLLSLHFVRFDINNMLNELEIFFQDFILKRDKKLALELDRSGFISPCIIEADPIRVRQILSNLVGNAVKFTDKGYIRFGYNMNEKGDELYFFVEDSGIGIPESKRKDIFERFKQAHDVNAQILYGGTGLGLTISKNIVEMMGGHIGVESVEGFGSTFYFTLPYKKLPVIGE